MNYLFDALFEMAKLNYIRAIVNRFGEILYRKFNFAFYVRPIFFDFGMALLYSSFYRPSLGRFRHW